MDYANSSPTAPAPARMFGSEFTDHMAVARWSAGSGWSPVWLDRFTDLSISPAAMVFHYGQAIFEGLKALRQPDGSVALFRPDANARRFHDSAVRMGMPPLPPDVFVEACAELVRADAGAVPWEQGEFLYLRPLMLATEAHLGVRAAQEYLFLVIASPAGAYFSDGAVTAWVARQQVRAAPGGLGAAKCAANYSASLMTKALAAEQGCNEVVWLDAVERRWVEELSGMNVVVVEDGRTLVTPPAGDTILDGVTRSCVLRLAGVLGYGVEERPLAVDEWRRGAESGRVTEAFACGTAAVVTPIGAVRDGGSEWRMPAAPGPVTMHVKETLVAIQEGRAPDPFGWRVPV